MFVSELTIDSDKCTVFNSFPYFWSNLKILVWYSTTRVIHRVVKICKLSPGQSQKLRFIILRNSYSHYSYSHSLVSSQNIHILLKAPTERAVFIFHHLFEMISIRLAKLQSQSLLILLRFFLQIAILIISRHCQHILLKISTEHLKHVWPLISSQWTAFARSHAATIFHPNHLDNHEKITYLADNKVFSDILCS